MTRAGASPVTASAPVAVDDLRPGMLLAEDIFDQQGRMLMTAGTALTDRHLRACQLWGIMSIRIRSEGAAFEAAGLVPTPEQYATAEAETRHRFRANNAEHPLVVELFRLCVDRAADRAASKNEAAHG